MTERKRFIKAAGTEVSTGRSQAEIERLLARYGAVGTGFARTYDKSRRTETIRVDFVVPDSFDKNAGKVPVRLPVSVRHVYAALFGEPRQYSYAKTDWTFVNDARYAQAERVAWRNLLLWIDAALSAAAVGAQTVTEAFLAHTLVVDGEGRTMRTIEYMDSVAGALAPGVRALLGKPAEEA